MKKITLLVVILLTSLTSYAQFPETFDTEIPSTWAIFPGTNGLGVVQTWMHSDTGEFPFVIWEDVTGGLAEDWLVSPQVAITNNNNTLTFDTTDFNAGDFFSNITVRVSSMGNQTNIPDFTTLLTITEADINTHQVFQTFSVDLSAYIGSNIFIAFVMTNDDGDAWAIDNIDLVGCAPPSNITATDFTQTTVDITIGESADYQLEWGVFPYAQGGLGSTGTAVITAGDSYQFTGLTPGTSYNVFVRKNCGGGSFSEYVETIIGTSPNLDTFPYSEDLEPDANQALLLNLGLSFFTNTSNWSFGQDDTTDGDTTNDFANDGISYLFSNNTFTDADADAWVYFGPLTLTAHNQYDFSFMQRNFETASLIRPNKDIEIVVSTTNDGANDTVLLTLDDLNNTSYVQRTASFIPTTSGDYYFGIRDKSGVLTGVTEANSVIVDSFSIEETLSIDEFDSNNFTYTYDKNFNVLNLESSTAMTNIEIYSILGQNVISKSLDHTNASINLSSLNDGVYIARVNIGNNFNTIKFIKN